MELINTHSHVYSSQMDADRKEVIERAIEKGIHTIILPDIDGKERPNLLATCEEYPQICKPLFGIHPTSVNETYEFEITELEKALAIQTPIGIGEIGLDLYWDKTFLQEQIKVFEYQMNIARELNLPVVIHVRNAFDEILAILKNMKYTDWKGIFHCFSGNLEHAKKVIEYGFDIGIGGVITYKNAGLYKIVSELSLKHIVVETDDPWLAPEPYRGKRNEPAYVTEVVKKIAECKETSIEEVAKITTANAQRIFTL